MLAGMSSTSDINDEICETGLTLLDGQTRTGTISPITDVDLYAIEITSAQLGRDITFNLNATDSSLDTYLRLFDADGVELDSNDDATLFGSTNSEIVFDDFSSPGTYFLGVSTSGNEDYNPNDGSGVDTDGFSSTGTYEIIFQDSDDTIDEALPGLDLLGLVGGVLDLGSDVDVYRFDAVEGTSYQFDAIAVGSPVVDTFIRVFDDGGNQVDFNDDGNGSNARLTVTFDDTDDFYVAVSSFTNRNYDVETGTGDSTTATDPAPGTGFYFLTATEVSLDPDDRIDSAIDLGNLFTDGTRLGSDSARFDGEIDTTVDVDL